MFAIPAEEEFAPDGDEGRQRGHREIVGAKQETQRQGGDQGALGIEERKVGEACSGILSEEGNTYRDAGLPGRQVEVQPTQTVNEKEAKAGDLVEAGIVPIG